MPRRVRSIEDTRTPQPVISSPSRNLSFMARMLRQNSRSPNKRFLHFGRNDVV